VYKTEFLSNAKTTFFKNVLDRKNLNLSSNNTEQGHFNNNVLALNSFNLSESLLKGNKNNFLESGKTQAFVNDLLFLSTSEDRVFKQNMFRKNQLINDKKYTPSLDSNYLVNSKL
jgi:hypothetical protein